MNWFNLLKKKPAVRYLRINLRCAESLRITKCYNREDLNKWNIYSAHKWEGTVS